MELCTVCINKSLKANEFSESEVNVEIKNRNLVCKLVTLRPVPLTALKL